MASTFSIIVSKTSLGVLGTIEQFVSLEYALVDNDVGALTLVLPDIYPQGWFATDTILEVYRTIDNLTSLEGESVWFVRDVSTVLTERGEWFVNVVAFDAKHLLARRIVNAFSGSSAASKTQSADNMMRNIVREQLGSSATADSAGARYIIDVEADQSLYQTIHKAFAWRNVLKVLQDIADELALTEYCAFHVVKAVGRFNDLEFRVRRGAWGVDHRGSGTAADPIIFSPENGSLFDAAIALITRDEVNWVKTGGQGEGSERATLENWSSTDIARSVFNRIEAFVDSRNSKTNDQLLSDANAYLAARAARLRFTGRVQQTAELKYGVNYRWGDIVTATAHGFTFDCHIKRVHVVLNEAGETINITLSGETIQYVLLI